MKYYNLIPLLGEGVEATAHIKFSGLEKSQRLNILKGNEITDIDASKIELKNVSKKFPDLMGRGSSEYFITDDFKTLLESMESADHLNFIRVKLRENLYWLLNVLDNVECFDWNESAYTTYESGALKSIEKLVLKEDKINDRNIFRMAEEPVYLFISQTLKDAIEANNLTGIAYDDVFEITTT